MEEFIPVLRRTKLFAGVGEEDVGSMLSCLAASLHRYKKGEFVLREGERLHDILVLAEGGLYIQGWGIAPVRMTGQVGWPGAGGYQLAQVADGIFQMTGQAVGEKDDTVGGRWRIDYANFKFFFQDGWGGESSKEITIDGNAAEHMSQGSDGNLNLVGTLEEGATYRMTVDFTGCTIDGNSITAGKEKVTFEKL